MRERADGSREIDVEGPAAEGKEGEVRATVILPKRADAHSEVAAGDALTLVPSRGGAGWIVHKNDGVALGFLPTQQAMHDAASERF